MFQDLFFGDPSTFQENFLFSIQRLFPGDNSFYQEKFSTTVQLIENSGQSSALFE